MTEGHILDPMQGRRGGGGGGGEIHTHTCMVGFGTTKRAYVGKSVLPTFVEIHLLVL